MLSKKKKIFVLVGMVTLLLVTGCLNIVLNMLPEKVDKDGLENVDFFVSYRQEIKTTRDQTILALDAIINNGASTTEAIKDAEAQKLTLIKRMETEKVLEGLIKALGFEDAAVTYTTDNISVIIKAPELTSQDTARVLDVIITETDMKATDVRVMTI